MELEIMTFVISVSIPILFPIPIPMPRFQCRDLQMAMNMPLMYQLPKYMYIHAFRNQFYLRVSLKSTCEKVPFYYLGLI